MKDGTPVSISEDWWIKRRPEIFNLTQQELYGKPIDPTIPVTWVVGAVTTGTTVVSGVSYPWRQKTFTGTVDKSSYPALRNTPIITAQCRFPAATGRKYPVVVTYGEGTGIFQLTAPYGFGTCSYTPTQVQPDSGGASLSSYIIGLVNNTQGEHIVTWKFDDGHGNVSTQTQKVIVKDVTSPTILSVSASPNVLGPPNHQMILVAINAASTDNCDPAPVVRIIAVASNEPVNGNGDGNTSPDWVVTGNLTLNLRAERAGGGNGRVYTITVESRDASGNTSVQTVTVAVPHNH